MVLVIEDELLVRIVKCTFYAKPGSELPRRKTRTRHSRCSKVGPRSVLTDVDMPDSLNGFEFSRLVKQGWPEVGVLVISGKTQPGPGDLPPGVEFVQKPIRPAALVERIHALLPSAKAADQDVA